MRNIGIFLGRPVKIDSNRLIEAFCKVVIPKLQKEYDNVYIIEDRSQSYLSKFIDEKPNIHFISIQDEKIGWKHFQQDYLNNIIGKLNLEEVILLHSQLSQNNNYSNYKMLSNLIDAISKNDKLTYNFTSTYNLYKKLVCYYYFATNYKVSHIVIDPQEIDISKAIKCKDYTRKFLLNEPSKNLVYYPYYLEYYKNTANEFNLNKKYNFVFAASAVSKDRLYLQDFKIDNLEDSIVNIYTTTKKIAFKQKEYLDLIGQSRYTLVIPPYDSESFSICRFFEAISLDCLPLIQDTCNLDSIKNTFEDIYDIIKEELVVNLDDISNFIKNTTEDKRVGIINKIKETKSYGGK